MFKTYYQSPIGIIVIKGNEEGIVELGFVEKVEEIRENAIVKSCLSQLDEYFNGQRTTFNVQLITEGTSFQQEVWQSLQEIPYGETRSYKAIASQINRPKAVRAVGGANNKNQIAIIIPCHRVIGSNQKLVGYEGGLWRKEWLLNHEKKVLSEK
jgi:methylated-DNA-[protein]-cysteine S-methyltransferase